MGIHQKIPPLSLRGSGTAAAMALRAACSGLQIQDFKPNQNRQTCIARECQDLGVTNLGSLPRLVVFPLPPSRRAYDNARPLRADYDEKLDSTNDTGFIPF